MSTTDALHRERVWSDKSSEDIRDKSSGEIKGYHLNSIKRAALQPKDGHADRRIDSETDNKAMMSTLDHTVVQRFEFMYI